MGTFMQNHSGGKAAAVSPSSSSADGGVTSIPIQHLNSPIRYCQQLACELEMRKDFVAEIRDRDDPPLVFTIGQPQTLTMTCPRKEVRLPRNLQRQESAEISNRAAATVTQFRTEAEPETRLIHSIGVIDNLKSQKTAGFCKDRGYSNGHKSEDVETDTAFDSDVTMKWTTDKQQIPTQSATKATLGIRQSPSDTQNGDPSLNGLSDITLSDFICNVIIPPPPSVSNQSLIKDVTKSSGMKTKTTRDVCRPQDFRNTDLDDGRTQEPISFALDSGPGRKSQGKHVAFTLPPPPPRKMNCERNEDFNVGEQQRNKPQYNGHDEYESENISLEDDYAHLVTPPPPPFLTDSYHVADKTSSSKHVPSQSTMGLITNAYNLTYDLPNSAQDMINRPSPSPRPVPHPRSSHPSTNNSHLTTLPPHYPKRPTSAGRSPSLRSFNSSSNATQSPSPTTSPTTPSGSLVRNQIPTTNKEVPSNSWNHSNYPNQDGLTFTFNEFDQRTNVVDNGFPMTQTNHKDMMQSSTVQNTTVTVGTVRTKGEFSHPRVHNHLGTLPRTAPPAPPPRVSSSIQSSPMMTKRSTRRVSFDQCPPYDNRQAPKTSPTTNNHPDSHVRNGGRMEATLPQSSSLSRLINGAMNWVGTQKQPTPTAQIRPSALRSSSSSAFQSVVNDEGNSGLSASEIMDQTGRRSSLSDSSHKGSTSILSNLKLRIKSYWSPSMSKRKSSLQDFDRISITSVSSWASDSVGGNDDDLERVDGIHRGRGSSRSKHTKNTRSVVTDAETVLRKQDLDDNTALEHLPCFQRESTPNTFNTFMG